ncbi:hypothetical protein ABFS83_12G038300 [Erythranthe nasuta]
MEFFQKANSVRLISYKDKYLVAESDQETIIQIDQETITTQERSNKIKSSPSIWTVELVENKDNLIRLKSCYGTYLTASNSPFLPGVTGKKVVQKSPSDYCDPATEWEPLRDGMQVRLRSFWGNFLRPNGGLPPWRNSVTHDIPHRPNTRNKLLWDVLVVEKRDAVAFGNYSKFGRSRSRSFSASMIDSNQVRNVGARQEII